jgi:tRNA dimethylallyltransferase
LAAPVLLAGPTAVGKSEVALSLAERLDGEIISVDSMQVYRGMDIGTAKPSLAERARVPHHLLDVVDLVETFDAAGFVRLAQAAAGEIRSRNRRPILCGGTGLYFKAFLAGLGDAPPTDPALRDTLTTLPLADLLRELAAADPATYERIDRQNPRRVVRAVEVIRLTGKPFSEQRADWSAASVLPEGISAFGLARTRDDLHARIDRRVEAMFTEGLVAETRRLLEAGLAENPTAMQALGYRQVVEHLRGERGLAETGELVKLRTRQFAKRQLTWFRRQMPLEWITLAPDTDSRSVADRILKFLR